MRKEIFTEEHMLEEISIIDDIQFSLEEAITDIVGSVNIDDPSTADYERAIKCIELLRQHKCLKDVTARLHDEYEQKYGLPK